MYLISLYNVNNKTMRTSGPTDPSASLFIVHESITDLAIAHPDAFRFIAVMETGYVISSIKPSVQSLTDKKRPNYLQPDKLEMLISKARTVNRDYFIKNLRVDSLN